MGKAQLHPTYTPAPNTGPGTQKLLSKCLYDERRKTKNMKTHIPLVFGSRAAFERTVC